MALTRRKRNPRHRHEPHPLALSLGRRVKALRAERDFTFDAFVEETGLGGGYISELERGLVVPTLETLARLSRALEVTMADLVLGDSQREKIFEATRDLPLSTLRELLESLKPLKPQRPAPAVATHAEPSTYVARRIAAVAVAEQRPRSRARRS